MSWRRMFCGGNLLWEVSCQNRMIIDIASFLVLGEEGFPPGTFRTDQQRGNPSLSPFFVSSVRNFAFAW